VGGPYNEGDVLRYSRGSKETGIAKASMRGSRVSCGQQPAHRRAEGRHGTKLRPTAPAGRIRYREQERAFSVGDRVQLTAPSRDLKLAKPRQGPSRASARMADELEDGWRPPGRDRFTEVPAPRSRLRRDESFQPGQTADRVLIHVDTEWGPRICSTTAWPTLPSHAAHTTRNLTTTVKNWERLWGMMFRTAAPTRRS